MIKTIYGGFENNQFKEYKEKLHKKMFWLLLYKDPKTKDKYPNVDFEKYFKGLMREIDGLNELLFYPSQIVEIMSLLEAAFIETQSEYFEYKTFRRLVLHAHHLVDEIKEG